MSEMTHVRRGRTITRLEVPAELDEEGNEVTPKKPAYSEPYPSINAAKKASRELQLKTDGRLGAGTLRVLLRKKTERRKASTLRAAHSRWRREH